MLIKGHGVSHIDAPTRMEASVTGMVGAVADENALGGTELKFVAVVGTEVRVAGAPKYSEFGVGWVVVIKEEER